MGWGKAQAAGEGCINCPPVRPPAVGGPINSVPHVGRMRVLVKWGRSAGRLDGESSQAAGALLTAMGGSPHDVPKKGSGLVGVLGPRTGPRSTQYLGSVLV